jgi:DNA replication protein DnaC
MRAAFFLHLLSDSAGAPLGPLGSGKTHLAIALAMVAAQSGRRVYYGALADLVSSLGEARSRRFLVSLANYRR